MRLESSDEHLQIGDFNMDEDSRLLTVSEVASYLAVPKSFIYGKTRTGEIPTVRVGPKYCRFSLPAIKKWLEKQQEERGVRR